MSTYIDEEALMKLIQRHGYIEFLRRNRERSIIKVVSGIRRCGKSTLFRLFKDELLAEGVKPEQIISINFEELEYEPLREYHALYQYILNQMQPNQMNYIFLDEIDAYKGDVEGEGDPVNLAIKRTSTFNRRKIFMVSTPTIQSVSRIEYEYEQSDQRHYMVPCP